MKVDPVALWWRATLEVLLFWPCFSQLARSAGLFGVQKGNVSKMFQDFEEGTEKLMATALSLRCRLRGQVPSLFVLLCYLPNFPSRQMP